MTETTGTGLGWDVSQVHEQKAVSWIGGAGTYGSIFMAMPERGLAVGVIDNYQEPDMEPLAEDILTIALGDEPQARQGRAAPSRRCSRIRPAVCTSTSSASVTRQTIASKPPMGRITRG